MNDFDQRRCARVPFRTPVHMQVPGGRVEASTCDLSRTGAGIRIEVPELSAGGRASLAEAAMYVHRHIGRAFDVQLNPDVLGSLLSKRVVVVRLADTVDRDGCLVLGCRFDEPLNDPEMVSLGVPLPPAQDEEQEWVPRADVPAPHFRQLPNREARAPRDPSAAREPAQAEERTPAEVPIAAEQPTEEMFVAAQLGGGGGTGWRAHLSGASSDAPPLKGRVDRVTGDGVVLRVWYDGEHLLEMFEATDVVTAILAFTRAYGQEPGVKLMNGAEHVWTGPTVLTEMALPKQAGGDVYVNLRFGRHLRPAELRSLGLERAESA